MPKPCGMRRRKQPIVPIIQRTLSIRRAVVPMGGNSGTGSSFYFYNSNAVSQGFNDFKRAWGNRKLEDNWRVSNRASSDITSSNSAQAVDPDCASGPGSQ